MAGIGDLIQVIVSCSVELGGNGVIHGSKNALLAGARKIGWASGGGGRQGKRFSGHSLAGKSLASGGCRKVRGGLHNYNPKADYMNRTTSPYKQALKSGSGVGGGGHRPNNGPAKLFGRPSFDRPSSVLGREGGDRYVRKSATRGSSFSKNPRANINFGK
jgi:hypothetical protein